MKTANGRFRRLGSNEARALRKLHQVRRLENGGDSVGALVSPRMTLRTVAERWFEAQRADGVRDVDRDFGSSRRRPKKRGKGGVPYRRHEAIALMTDARIPADRKMLNTLQALTGMRIGEACGRRWRDYDRETPGLGAIHVWSQYEDRPLKTGRAAHEKERFVPVRRARQAGSRSQPSQADRFATGKK